MKATLALLFIMTTNNLVNAQSLPPTSRTIYKCETGGKVVYSDAPCIGAKKIDAEPTKGANKITGKERIGKDVMMENNTEVFTKITHATTGQSPESFERQRRRIYLSPQDKISCAKLDIVINYLEKEEASAKKEQLRNVQENLYNQRLAYRNLRC